MLMVKDLMQDLEKSNRTEEIIEYYLEHPDKEFTAKDLYNQRLAFTSLREQMSHQSAIQLSQLNEQNEQITSALSWQRSLGKLLGGI